MRAALTTGLVLAALAAGCSTIEGTAQPAPLPGNPALPLSPREFDVTILDTCALIPAERREELGLDLTDAPYSGESDTLSELCVIPAATSTELSSAVSAERDAADIAEQPGAVEAVVVVVEHDGFRVPLTEAPAGGQPSCNGIIAATDTSATSLLAVSVEPSAPAPCSVLAGWVPVVLDTLQQLQPAR